MRTFFLFVLVCFVVFRFLTAQILNDSCFVLFLRCDKANERSNIHYNVYFKKPNTKLTNLFENRKILYVFYGQY